MRNYTLPALLFSLLTATLSAQDPDIRVDASYFSDGATNPLVDNAGVALTAGPSGDNGDGAVIRIGYLNGVPIAKDPSTFSPADWATFVPLSGDGLNFDAGRDFPGYSSIGDLDSSATGPFGFFGIATTYFSSGDSNIPATFPQRIAIQFYNGTTVAGSTHFTTVSSSNSEWELNLLPELPLPGDESTLDLDNNVLAWQGTALKTDQVIGGGVPDLLLTDVSLTAPTSLQVTWTGGDGTNNIETSPDGLVWTPVAFNQASPASITVATTLPRTLLVRVVEP